MRNAISYMRFSSKRQEKGSSIDRQKERLDAYLAANPDVVLIDTFRDEGVSGFTGQHAKAGAMGRFMAMLANKRIPTPIILIVEALDRFSREPAIDAHDRLSELTKAGVTLIFLDEKVEISRASLRESPMVLFQIWGQMMANHAFSVRKSGFAKGGWNKSIHLAASERKAIRGYDGCPWTVIDPATGKYALGWKDEKTNTVVLGEPPIVGIIRLIYRWRIEGVADHAIAKRLNERGAPLVRAHVGPQHKRRGWYQSTIHRILSDRRVLGEGQFRGEPVIPDLFPRIIDEDTFARAQAAKSPVPTRLGSDDGVSAIANLFTGFARCSCCGGNMVMTRNRGGAKATRYLTCDARKRRLDCTSTGMVNYSRLESVILEHLPLIPWETIVQADNPHDPLPEIEAQISTSEAQAVEIAHIRDNAKRLMLKGGDYEAEFEPIFQNSLNDLRSINAKLSGLKATRLRLIDTANQRPKLVRNAIEYRDTMNIVSPTEQIVIREKLASALRQIIMSMVCDTAGRQVRCRLSPSFAVVVVLPIRRPAVVVAEIYGPAGVKSLPMPKLGEAGHRFLTYQLAAA